jgi:precorrin-2 dehydrogenase/sirohydrochlorin ferrochelatase
MAHGYPITLQLADKLCLVVGGGSVATRKVHSLLQAGARVRVIAPALTEELQLLTAQGVIQWEQRPAGAEDLAGAWLVISAADDAATNELIGRAALAAGLLVNVVDQPALCSFYVPATVHRGPVSLSISTDGASPLLARRLRERLEEVIGPEYGELAELLARLRKELHARQPQVAARLQTWATLELEPVLEKLRAGQAAAAEAQVRAHLEAAADSSEEA